MSSEAAPVSLKVAEFVAIFLSPVVVRSLLLLEGDLGIRAADLRGLFADLGVSMLIASGIAVTRNLHRWSRLAATALVLCWVLANFVNYEHIRELGSTVALAYAGYAVEPTFLVGSGLASTHPVILLGVVTVSCTLLWLPHRDREVAGGLKEFLAAIMVIVIITVWPHDPRSATWRQTNFVLAQAVGLVQGRQIFSSPRDHVHRNVVADLRGEEMIAARPRADNVLLIILEGVSGRYLPSLREHHGAPGDINMAELDQLATQGMSWSTFIAHQRQTNRGEYALLCGDYPKLETAEPKMTQLAAGGQLDCLPSVLSDSGFRTVYLQAAPMAFMLKDQFIPKAGFDTSVGDSWFEHSYSRNSWGVDDRAFFEQSLRMVGTLQEHDQPWFLTLLTVGTHHPFNVPDNHVSIHPEGSTGWAMEYLDQAIGEFVRQLKQRGDLDDTLVLITSDESRHVTAGSSDVENMLGQAWGFLIVLAPSGDRLRVEEPFMQVDIPISILDYLDLSDHTRGFGGRSVFRRYQKPRSIFWANTHYGLVAGLSSSGRLGICTENFAACVSAQVDATSLFAPGMNLSPAEPKTLEWLFQGVQASMETSAMPLVGRELQLTARKRITVVMDESRQFVFGGQFLTIPAGTRADVDIEVEVLGTEGWVDFENDLIIGRRQQYVRSGRAGVGDVVRIQYSVTTEVDLRDVECRFWLDGRVGVGLELRFQRALIRMSGAARDKNETAIVEHRFEIRKSPP